ncbi:NTP transferase domain-containing protein [Candidatus Micrarchaeota archaeon]|nr:NTP transferase domain-containing protein [Candidatus Micrarchaeota archaeon]
MINLIPMAGLGKRFADEGYALPKPLIPVSGKPMIVMALSMMPKADITILVCRKEHVEQYHIDKEISKHISNVHCIPIDFNTEGQACTCLLARDFIDTNEPLFIGACDNGMLWDEKKFKELTEEKDSDVVCWAFKGQNNVLLNPNAWGWIKTREDGKTIERVSVKVPVSDKILNDPAVIGSFWFRTGKLFIEIAEDLIKNNIRVNNEFYVDSCVGHAIKRGYTSKVFIVDQYVGWGTPKDLREYEFWEKYFCLNKRCSL